MQPEQAASPGFAAFLAYLTQRQRAGIVKPPLPEGEGSHTLYLVPATLAVCEALAVPFEDDALLVLVLAYDT